MTRTSVSLCVGVVGYIFAMAGIGVLGVKLASVVATKTIALSLPYLLDKDPRKPSRMEQRLIDVAQAIPPLPIAKVSASAVPSVSYDVLAAQLDLSEEGDPNSWTAPPVRAKLHLRRFARKLATPPAADAFNRSFGVIPVASN